VGTGFHPELTGRENIYLNGTILGMKRAEIDRKFDEIVDFAEIEKFLDTPVKRYSSGMYVRLAFAVAAHLEPEVMVVDEVLAVGDAQFQKKCLGKMGEVAEGGRTVLFVSHNMGTVLQLCSRVILFKNGYSVSDGDTSMVVSKYLTQLQDTSSAVSLDFNPDKDVQLTYMAVVSSDGNIVSTQPHTQSFDVIINYRVTKWPVGSYVCLDVFNEAEIRLLWSSDVHSVEDMLIEREPGMYLCRFTIPEKVLSPGQYHFTSAIYAPGRPNAADVLEKAVSIEITDGGSLLANFGIKPHSATMLSLSWQTQRIGD
jgi:lipopolysaccharide transport system ATP-binding protein